MFILIYIAKEAGDKNAGKIKMAKDPLFIKIVDEVNIYYYIYNTLR
jgi:hypothetical protein